MTEPAQHRVEIGGVSFCYFEWGEVQPNKPTVLMAHATGFHARCWDQIAALLGDQHLIALDQRGHGRSDSTPPFDWKVFGNDLVSFIEQLDLRQIVGVGHSMGGHAMVQACAKLQSRFSALVLVDPVILPPPAYAAHVDQAPESHPVARRRNHFSSASELAAQLEGRGGFAHFTPAALQDYCQHGLLPDPEGEGYVLACPPLVEATIYTGSTGSPVFEEVRAIECPVTLLRAAPRDERDTRLDFSKSPTWTELAREFRNVTDEPHPELSHFIPMQAPSLVARHIGRYAAR